MATEALDELLAMSGVDTLTSDLGRRFTNRVLLLVPSLTDDELEVLRGAVESAFDETTLREDIAASMTEQLEPGQVDGWLQRRRAGPESEMDALRTPSASRSSVADLAGELTEEDRARLQLMVALVGAQGRGDLSLLVEEALNRAAHNLVNALGADLGTFEPATEEQFRSAYRRESLTLALALLQEHEAVSDTLIRQTLEEYRSADGQAFVDAMTTATVSAIHTAAGRVAELTAPRPEDDVASTAEAADVGLPCRGYPCGYVVDWSGPVPSGINRRFGAAQEIEIRVFRYLLDMGYRLERGTTVDDGMTITLRPRLTAALCEVTAGWYNTACAAIGRVRVEFLGTPPGHERPNNFVVVNRCGANGIMGVQGISAMVAIRLDLHLTTFPGDERKPPNC